MSGLYGWIGQILKVDLTKGNITTLETLDYVPKFLGGRGLAAKLYWDEVSPDCTALSPDNALIFTTGPLNGTLAPAASKTHLAFKSPARSFIDALWWSSGGGNFASQLKYAGYDGVVIKGKAAEPVYLWIHDGEAEIKSAAYLWGQDTVATQREILGRHGDTASCWVIGPAGEHLCLNAVITSELDSTMGRGGCGAVMGSKNLKAIAARGTGRVTVARPREHLDLSYEIERLMSIKEQEATGTLSPPNMRQYRRSFDLHDPLQAKTTAGSLMHEEEKSGKVRLGFGACHGCGTQCRITIKSSDGQLAWGGVCCDVGSYRELEKSYYGNELPWGRSSVMVSDYCNRMGISHHYLYSGIFPWFKWCVDAGVLTDENTGLPLAKYGSTEFGMQFFHKCAYREGDFGELLAMDAPKAMLELERRMKERGESKKAYEVRKYYELLFPLSGKFAGGQPIKKFYNSDHILPTMLGDIWERAIIGVFRTYGLGPRITEEEKGRVEARLGERYFGDKNTLTDRRGFTGKVPLTIYLENLSHVMEGMVWCREPFSRFYATQYHTDYEGDPSLIGKVYSATTGDIKTTEELINPVGEMLVNLERCIWVREGRRREDDWFGDYVFEAHDWLTKKELKEQLDKYYTARGWDLKTGIPTRAKLEELGLKDVANDLEKAGISVS